MSEIWTIMTATLGVPPRPDDAFTWEYLDGDGKFRSWSGTPLEFYKAFTSRQYPVGGVYLNQITGEAKAFVHLDEPRGPYGYTKPMSRLTARLLGNVGECSTKLCRALARRPWGDCV